MNDFIDPDMQTGSTHYANLTHYFKVMSEGKFEVVGEAVYVETPQDMDDYGVPPNRPQATEDVLVNKVDPIINFQDYDNWRRDSEYNHTNTSDGIVDMIFMVWRGFVFETGWTGEASLGRGPEFILDGKIIKTQFTNGNGSGVTIHYGNNLNRNKNTQTMAHELGHWLLGGCHPYETNTSTNQHALWSILGRNGTESICANAYERERLDWIDPVEITSYTTQVSLLDYLTSGVAYKYHPPNGANREFYYFETHLKTNTVYDDITLNPSDKGIFVLHMEDVYRNDDNIRCKTSDGQWNWTTPFFTTGCPEYGPLPFPAYRQVSVNADGKNHRDQEFDTNGKADWIRITSEKGSQFTCGVFRRGEHMDGSFNLVHNSVMSPWSNPSTDTWGGLQTDFAVELIDLTSSSAVANFYVNNSIDAKPAKVHDLEISASANDHPYLEWTANSESDIVNYKIYKRKENPTFDLLATIPSTQNFYEDTTETIPTEPEPYEDIVAYKKIS